MNTTLNYIALPSYLLPSYTIHTKVAAKGSKDRSTNDPEASTDLVLRQWEQTYARGHKVGPGSCVLSTASFLYAARMVPASRGVEAVNPDLKGWYYVAAAFAAVAVPFTVLFILPTNNELYRRAAAARSAQKEVKAASQRQDDSTHAQGVSKGRSPRTTGDAGSELSSQHRVQDLDTLTLIRNCLLLSKFRAFMPLPAILIGVWTIARTTQGLILRDSCFDW
ncbi:hypothetical protein RBB50_004293 [Rhinocladiella similis]